jgi:AcrR family transcriptional regulator
MELEKIYQVAEKHFFAKQYNDVKLDNIANELGIKKPSLYYYFENKRDFFIKTLRYSMKKYIVRLREVIKGHNLDAFIHWYLDYPSKNKNLFAIAAQKGYGEDKEINHTIKTGKQVIDTETAAFLGNYGLKQVDIYLITNLLDKLAMDNCIDGYCLEYSIDDLTQQIGRLMTSTTNMSKSTA